MIFLSKNVYRTEIDSVEPKLWGFTCVTLILGHPVQFVDRKTIQPVTNKLYDSFLSKNVYRTEIDSVRYRICN